jgi:hypothetical protein
MGGLSRANATALLSFYYCCRHTLPKRTSREGNQQAPPPNHQDRNTTPARGSAPPVQADAARADNSGNGGRAPASRRPEHTQPMSVLELPITDILGGRLLDLVQAEGSVFIPSNIPRMPLGERPARA